MLKRPELFTQGYHVSFYPGALAYRELVLRQEWEELDRRFREETARDGQFYKFLQQFHVFETIEFIISIRDATNDWEEDGIWHDDGSRLFAFSLSLTLDEQLQGGRLGIRPKGEEGHLQLPTPGFGGVILFLTGIYGFEHKTHRVTQGKRVVLAGWCS
jgi:hypothetical protein